jgi:hypothetical protein
MKVRISGNKIRFRLKEPEVRRFQQDGIISEVLAFGFSQADQLTFTLKKVDESEMSVSFLSSQVSFYIPKARADDWTSTDLVGFEATVNTGQGKVILLLVEKDFKCLDAREEDNEGSYPNPLANPLL